MEWADLDRDLSVLQVRRKVTTDGQYFLPKDKRDRVLPVSALVWDALQDLGYENGHGYVIPLPKVKSRPNCFERTHLGRLAPLFEQLATLGAEGGIVIDE